MAIAELPNRAYAQGATSSNAIWVTAFAQAKAKAMRVRFLPCPPAGNAMTILARCMKARGCRKKSARQALTPGTDGEIRKEADRCTFGSSL